MIAFTRKYDFARIRAAAVVSASEANRSSSMPVELSDSIRRSGSAVVLLNDIAGVTHDGSLKKRVVNHPNSIELRA